MIYQLLHLPYLTYWLPVVAAVLVATPLYYLLRPRLVPSEPVDIAPTDAAPKPVATSSEQRRSFRRAGNPIGVLYKRAQLDEQPIHASLVDRSMGGLCLLTTEAIPTGTVLGVRAVNAEEIVPWIEVEVCSCRMSDGDKAFELGCRYVKTPPYSMLLQFG
jgi:hypothetical protein